MTVTNKRLAEILTTAMEKPEIANALIQRVINTLNQQGKREWQSLTDMEKIEIQNLKWWDWEDTFDLDGYTRAIEAKLKKKNHA